MTQDNEKQKSRVVINLTADQIELIKANGSSIDNGDRYYFLPFWFKEIGDSKFEMYALGNLPKELTDILEKRGTIFRGDDHLQFPLTEEQCFKQEGGE